MERKPNINFFVLLYAIRKINTVNPMLPFGKVKKYGKHAGINYTVPDGTY